MKVDKQFFGGDKITAVVAVRKGSQRIPNKNIVPFGSSNLLEMKLQLLKKVSKKYNISIEDTNYLVFTDKVSNNAYQYHKTHINILMKNMKGLNFQKN